MSEKSSEVSESRKNTELSEKEIKSLAKKEKKEQRRIERERREAKRKAKRNGAASEGSLSGGDDSSAAVVIVSATTSSEDAAATLETTEAKSRPKKEKKDKAKSKEKKKRSSAVNKAVEVLIEEKKRESKSLKLTEETEVASAGSEDGKNADLSVLSSPSASQNGDEECQDLSRRQEASPTPSSSSAHHQQEQEQKQRRGKSISPTRSESKEESTTRKSIRYSNSGDRHTEMRGTIPLSGEASRSRGDPTITVQQEEDVHAGRTPSNLSLEPSVFGIVGASSRRSSQHTNNIDDETARSKSLHGVESDGFSGNNAGEEKDNVGDKMEDEDDDEEDLENGLGFLVFGADDEDDADEGDNGSEEYEAQEEGQEPSSSPAVDTNDDDGDDGTKLSPPTPIRMTHPPKAMPLSAFPSTHFGAPHHKSIPSSSATRRSPQGQESPTEMVQREGEEEEEKAENGNEDGDCAETSESKKAHGHGDKNTNESPSFHFTEVAEDSRLVIPSQFDGTTDRSVLKEKELTENISDPSQFESPAAFADALLKQYNLLPASALDKKKQAVMEKDDDTGKLSGDDEYEAEIAQQREEETRLRAPESQQHRRRKSVVVLSHVEETKSEGVVGDEAHRSPSHRKAPQGRSRAQTTFHSDDKKGAKGNGERTYEANQAPSRRRASLSPSSYSVVGGGRNRSRTANAARVSRSASQQAPPPREMPPPRPDAGISSATTSTLVSRQPSFRRRPPLKLDGPPQHVNGFNLNDLLTECRDKFEDAVKANKVSLAHTRKAYREEKGRYAQLKERDALTVTMLTTAFDDGSDTNSGTNSSSSLYLVLEAQIAQRLAEATRIAMEREARLREEKYSDHTHHAIEMGSKNDCRTQVNGVKDGKTQPIRVEDADDTSNRQPHTTTAPPIPPPPQGSKANSLFLTTQHARRQLLQHDNTLMLNDMSAHRSDSTTLLFGKGAASSQRGRNVNANNGSEKEEPDGEQEEAFDCYDLPDYLQAIARGTTSTAAVEQHRDEEAVRGGRTDAAAGGEAHHHLRKKTVNPSLSRVLWEHQTVEIFERYAKDMRRPSLFTAGLMSSRSAETPPVKQHGEDSAERDFSSGKAARRLSSGLMPSFTAFVENDEEGNHHQHQTDDEHGDGVKSGDGTNHDGDDATYHNPHYPLRAFQEKVAEMLEANRHFTHRNNDNDEKERLNLQDVYEALEKINPSSSHHSLLSIDDANKVPMYSSPRKPSVPILIETTAPPMLNSLLGPSPQASAATEQEREERVQRRKRRGNTTTSVKSSRAPSVSSAHRIRPATTMSSSYNEGNGGGDKTVAGNKQRNAPSERDRLTRNAIAASRNSKSVAASVPSADFEMFDDGSSPFGSAIVIDAAGDDADVSDKSSNRAKGETVSSADKDDADKNDADEGGTDHKMTTRFVFHYSHVDGGDDSEKTKELHENNHAMLKAEEEMVGEHRIHFTYHDDDDDVHKSNFHPFKSNVHPFQHHHDHEASQRLLPHTIQTQHSQLSVLQTLNDEQKDAMAVDDSQFTLSLAHLHVDPITRNTLLCQAVMKLPTEQRKRSEDNAKQRDDDGGGDKAVRQSTLWSDDESQKKNPLKLHKGSMNSTGSASSSPPPSSTMSNYQFLLDYIQAHYQRGTLPASSPSLGVVASAVNMNVRGGGRVTDECFVKGVASRNDADNAARSDRMREERREMRRFILLPPFGMMPSQTYEY